jgi:hypothetical protein
MVDAVDSFLNIAVDLYIQAVEYCQISTSQISTLVSGGIQQIRPESGENPADITGFQRYRARLAGAAGSPAI